MGKKIWGPVALVLSIGCAPQIHEFRASPRQACPQTRVKLSWDVVGNARISSDNPAAWQGGDVAEHGEHEVDPTSTTYKLVVSRLWRKAIDAAQQVQAVPSSSERKLGGDATGCAGDTAWVDFKIEDVEFDPAGRVVTLRQSLDRPLVVEHAGRQVTVEPGTPLDLSTAGGSFSLAGAWKISAKLGTGEVCGTPSARPVAKLGVRADLRCGDGGAQ